jgi:hypothetical protein
MSAGPRFAGDDVLTYRAQAFRFAPGRALALDAVYRTRQLPLVDPAHPAVIPADGEYVMGRYARARLSLVLFVPLGRLADQPAYQALRADLGRASVGGKIAWEVLERRRDVLHATICSGLDAAAPASEVRRIGAALAATAPFRVRVAGPWVSESFNTGRLYLPVYPELRDGGADAIASVQRRLGCRESRFYAVGALNLTGDLTPAETAELGAVVAAYRETILLEATVRELHVAATHDDLLLESRRTAAIPLTGAAPGRVS